MATPGRSLSGDPTEPGQSLLKGLLPVFRADARVLVLGSLPGGKSLAAGRYYAHPRNQFWQLMGKAIGMDLASLAYQQRLAAVVRHRIALWDVVAAGFRSGSLDSSLRMAERADLPGLIARMPELRLIAFNGGFAARYGAMSGLDVPVLALPSSSPANTAPVAVKQARWNRIADYL